MGAVDNWYVTGALTEMELREYHENLVEQYRHEAGHGGYTGTFAESTGLVIIRRPLFHTIHEAEDYLRHHIEKWEPDLAVKVEFEEGWKWVVAGVHSE